VPLFSGYLFARFDPSIGKETIKYTIGVRDLVMSGGEPVTVPAAVIDFMRQLITDNEAQRLVGARSPAKGKAFRAELKSLFVKRLSADERLLVLLRVIGAVKDGA
jgi:hypothetical protein